MNGFTDPNATTPEQDAWSTYADRFWPDHEQNRGSKRWHDLRMSFLAGWQARATTRLTIGGPHVPHDDVMERLAESISGWTDNHAPNVLVECRADLLTSAYQEIAALRATRMPPVDVPVEELPTKGVVE